MKIETRTNMTPEAQRIAIAEACGFINARMWGDNWLDYCKTLERELTAALEELKEVTEQRDRMAEAFRKIKKAGGTHDDSYDELDFIADVIFEALQSLDQPTEL